MKAHKLPDGSIVLELDGAVIATLTAYEAIELFNALGELITPGGKS